MVEYLPKDFITMRPFDYHLGFYWESVIEAIRLISALFFLATLTDEKIHHTGLIMASE
jgi:hypothetical protein